MTQEEIIWKHYKRFRRKYKQELPEWFKPFVIVCMEEWEKQQQDPKASCGCRIGNKDGIIQVCSKCFQMVS